LKSKYQKGIKIQTKIKLVFKINSAFFIKSYSISLLNKIIQSRNKIKKEIKEIQEVFHCIQSDQFNALKTKTYQKIVKNIGMI
jgi:hypothetical protein